MTQPKIRFIIDHYSSEHDMYGNSYHFSRVVATKTGKSITFLSDALCNDRNMIRDAMKIDTWGHIHESEITFSKRKWKACSSDIDIYPHHLTPETFKALERTNGNVKSTLNNYNGKFE